MEGVPTKTHHGRVSKENGKQKMEKGGKGDVVSEWTNLGAMSDEPQHFQKFQYTPLHELFATYSEVDICEETTIARRSEGEGKRASRRNKSATFFTHFPTQKSTPLSTRAHLYERMFETRTNLCKYLQLPKNYLREARVPNESSRRVRSSRRSE